MKSIGKIPVCSGILVLIACSSSPSLAFAADSKLRQSFNDTVFELVSCELQSDRTAICQMTVNNRYTDKRIEVAKGITIQDDKGNEYAVTSGGFGDPSTGQRWLQTAVADSVYNVQIVAPNISSQATSVRAVVFPRLLVRSTQGQTLGYRDRVVFARPPMIRSNAVANGAAERKPPQRPMPPSTPSLSGTSAAPSTPTVSVDGMPIATDEWQLVGLWSYDAQDGQHIPAQGYVLLPKPGAGVGQAWLARLELRNHERLPERDRALWPVKIHVEQRKVCADYPNYPSYKVFIDLPGDEDDAVYSVAECKGGDS